MPTVPYSSVDVSTGPGFSSAVGGGGVPQVLMLLMFPFSFADPLQFWDGTESYLEGDKASPALGKSDLSLDFS